uniref:CR-type domain-containing protein n=1 Tax=Strombidium inclinatum TaxID=197538 RepID=A0A7S3MVS5_9SPIT|mmetsp:Transcript_18932/g.29054  ORF Transcript_18932/g.29054 Transcript_18932/m.29054 type:complete len:244 (+) Transcript_18932:366-1097(+)
MQKGPNARADIHVTLEDLYLGSKRTLNINRNIYCTQCRGSGAKDGKTKTCPTCKGRGVSMQTINMMGMQMQMQQTCTTCGGKGTTMAAKCPHCKGKRVVNDNKKVTIDVEKGMANGDTIVLEKEAEQVPDLARGDLIFTLKQKSHGTFRRVGDNLFLSTTLTLEEAIFGFKKTVKHLDGHQVVITPQPNQILQHNEWIIVDGEGMPKRNTPSEFGDLHVQVKIKLPTKLSEKQMDIIAQVFPE